MELISVNDDEILISSLDFLSEIVNPARLSAGESRVEHKKFRDRIEDELKNDHETVRVNFTFTEEINNLGFKIKRRTKIYELNYDQALRIGMRESKSVRKVVSSRLSMFVDRHLPPLPPTTHLIPTSFSEALQLAADQAKKIEIDKPKVDFANRVSECKAGVSLGEFAKAIGMGRNRLFAQLRLMHVLIGFGSEYNNPYQKFIDSGYFSVRQSTYSVNGEYRVTNTALITGKGEVWLTQKIKQAQI